MATSNFYYYDQFPNLFFMTDEEIEASAEAHGIIYDENDLDGYYEKFQRFIADYYDGYRTLCDDEMRALQADIAACNAKIKAKGGRLYYESPRAADQEEGEYLRSVYLSIEPGYYQGAQIKINGDYRYINKTNKRLLARLMKKIARRSYLYGYDLAYRFSNGETAFNNIKKYRPLYNEAPAM